jgi:hypothetical protein
LVLLLMLLLLQASAASGSSWVLGWQFAAGEHLQQQRDVFGDEGISDVFLTPSEAQGAAGTPQGIAVFSEFCSDCPFIELCVFCNYLRFAPMQQQPLLLICLRTDDFIPCCSLPCFSLASSGNSSLS